METVVILRVVANKVHEICVPPNGIVPKKEKKAGKEKNIVDARFGKIVIFIT